MRKLKLRAKRFLPLLLALAVLFSSASPALGAETVSDAASTIQLMKTEGDVSVTNRSGRALSVRKDMRLYSGYHAKTEEESYAWVNLDSSKLIKLDEVSEAEVRKSGKKLEVLLDSGNLYFDVSQPLDRTESLNIRTSTMIVGIRGTCGWVKMFDAWHAQVYLLEGRVECSVTDPATGESRTTVLQGGETAEFVVYPQGQTGERCEIIRESYSEEEIDGFVLVELVKDQPLCEKIYADSSLDVLGRYDQDSAQKRLEEDQAAMGEKLGQIEKDLSAQDNHVSQDPVWDGGSKDSGGSDSSGGGSDSSGGGSDSSGGDSGSGDSGGSTTPPESSVVTLTMPVTDMALQQALNRPAVRQVVVAPGSTAPGAAPAALDIGINMAVDSGKTLTLNSGVPVRVQGSLTVNGTVDAGDDLTNDGTVTVNSANTLRVAGSLTNNGAMTVTATGRCVTEGAFTNSAGASLALTEGAQVLARRFVLTAPVEGWSVSSTQSDGYYRLEPSASEPSVPEDPGVTAGDFTVTGGALDTDFSYADGVLTILTDTALTIKNTDPSTATTDHIVVSANVNANITLAGVNINAPDSNIYAFHIDYAETETGTGTGTVTVTLAGTNSLQRGLFRPGLNARGAAQLTIGGTGTLTDDGPVADEPQPIIEANHLTMNGGTVDGEITASSFALNSGTVNGNVNVDNSLTMTAGAVNGKISVSSFAMTGGKVNGEVSVIPIGDSPSFTISGGEIVSSKNHAVTAADGVTLNLTGGTITCDASNYSALSLGNTTDFPAECKTVIRGKDFAMQSLPNGYANNLHDDDKYYYLEPSAAAGDFTVIGGTEGTDYSFDTFEDGSKALTILTGTPLTIQNADPDTATTDRILVNDGVSANVTLAGVNIDVSSQDACALRTGSATDTPGTGNVKITLVGDNFLSSGNFNPGLDSTGAAQLTIGGTGTLTATGGTHSMSGDFFPGGPGIGGGNIIISGGTITALTGATNGDSLSIETDSFTMSGGTLDAVIRADTVTISDGKINGAVSGITDSFTISGGEIASDANKDYTVSVDQTATVHLNGGTITNNCTSEASGRYGAILITESFSAIEGEIKTDIRGKKDDLMALCRLTPDTLYGPFTPDGYAVRGPADDGYYHLVSAPTGDFTVTGGTKGTDYRFDTFEDDSKALTILTDTPLTIQNTDPSVATDDCILVNDGVSANITLAGVNIDVSSTGLAGSSSEAGELGQAAFKAGSGGTVTVTLTGTNTLLGGHGRAGLEAGETADSTLIVQGSGALTATGGSIYTYQELGSYYSSGSGAGIGASYGNGPGNIVIEGGTITANSTGMANSVGIGSNTLPADSANSVQITGGTITGGPSSTDRSVITKQLTMSGGTVNGDIAASSFNMSAGTVNGRVLAVRSSFTISGGEIASSDRRTVEAASDLASIPIIVNLNGGTITNNSNEADCSAILIGQYTTITGAIETDIRSKSGETLIVCSNSPTDYTPYTPDGYAVTGPDETGYYHLVPWGKTTLSSDSLTAAAIQNELDKADVDEVYISGSGAVTLDGDLNIPSGKVVTMEGGTSLTIGEANVSAPTVTVNGMLDMENSANFNNHGSLRVGPEGTVLAAINFQNSGVIENDGTISFGYTNSTVILNGGTNSATGELRRVTNRGTIDFGGTDPNSSGVLENSGTITGITRLILSGKTDITGGTITANSTGSVLELRYGASVTISGGTVTQESASGHAIGWSGGTDGTLSVTGGEVRGKNISLLWYNADMTDTMGYRAEQGEDGYYYLVKKEENP